MEHSGGRDLILSLGKIGAAVFGVLAAGVLLLAGAAYALLSFTAGECEHSEIGRYTSPDGASDAVIFERACFNQSAFGWRSSRREMPPTWTAPSA